eukprot:scaffold47767_cov36-Tisochrysis_lutea.AAC.2
MKNTPHFLGAANSSTIASDGWVRYWQGAQVDVRAVILGPPSCSCSKSESATWHACLALACKRYSHIRDFGEALMSCAPLKGSRNDRISASICAGASVCSQWPQSSSTAKQPGSFRSRSTKSSEWNMVRLRLPQRKRSGA